MCSRPGSDEATPLRLLRWASGCCGGQQQLGRPWDHRACRHLQGGLHIVPPALTFERNDFLPNDSSESDGDDLAEGRNSDGDPENVRFAYCRSTWSKNHQTYNWEPMAFEDESYGLTREYTDPFLYSLI